VTPVLDASALLALIYREPGYEHVEELLADAVISTVNWTEVIQKLYQRNHPNADAVTGAIRALGVDILPFTLDHSVRAGLLWETTRKAGLSLGDRACLALAASISGGTAITADRVWGELDVKIPVQVIR
jgi:PIN domain nuclease of toxin-antitoxin system